MSFGAFVPLPIWSMKLRPYRSALPLMLQRQKGLPPFMPEFAARAGWLRYLTTADDLKTTHLGEIFVCSDFVIFQADDFFNILMYLALVAACFF